MKERRKNQREVINRIAHFTSEVCPTPQQCLLTDVSDGGARLFSDLEMPPRFTLTVSRDDGVMKRQCRVVWQIGGELGVEFI